MPTRWKVVYAHQRERRCSSSTLSSGAGSTPPHDRLQQFRAMKDETPESDDRETVQQLEIQCEDQMWEVMNMIQAGRAVKFHECTHLKIVINSTNFGDWEDDLW